MTEELKQVSVRLHEEDVKTLEQKDGISKSQFVRDTIHYRLTGLDGLGGEEFRLEMELEDIDREINRIERERQDHLDKAEEFERKAKREERRAESKADELERLKRKRNRVEDRIGNLSTAQRNEIDKLADWVQDPGRDFKERDLRTSNVKVQYAANNADMSCSELIDEVLATLDERRTE